MSGLCSKVDLNLRNLLFNVDSQRRFVLYMRTELDNAVRLSESLNLLQPHMLYIAPDAVVVDTPSPVVVDDVAGAPKHGRNTPLSTLLSCRHLDPDDTSPRAVAAKITLNMAWAADAQPNNNVLCWYVISILYASHRARKLVSQHTERGLATCFFHDFEKWFEYRLLGCVVPKTSGFIPKSKRAKTFHPAYTPTQIVADLRLFFVELQRSPAVASGSFQEDTAP
jgi:hypothetical protein